MTIVLTLVGLVVGAFLGLPGAILGAAVGFGIGRLQELTTDVSGLARRVDKLAGLTAEVHRRAKLSDGPADEPEIVPDAEPIVAAPSEPEDVRVAVHPVDVPDTPTMPARTPIDEVESYSDILRSALSWVAGGNTLARVAILVLFVGFVFVVKYTVENALLSLELRMVAAGVSGLALFFLGWRLRAQRREYGLTLQGGGLAILYLTVYASFYLYALIPGALAFLAMAVISIVTAFIAVRQQAQVMALIAVLGGFAAPMLASSGEGNVLVLFTYYGLLNLGILAIGWFRPWRSVTLVGLVCTFGLAGLWGGLSYAPADYAIAQPFLIVFFLQYFAILMLATRQRRPQVGRLMDGTLVFGLPLAAFTLQAGLVLDFEYGLAWSALVVGVFYLAASAGVYRRVTDAVRVLFEAFFGTGLAFVTMTLPFALDAPWSGTGWALEGAALVWLGLRQNEYRLRMAGVALQLVAAIMLLENLDSIPSGLTIVNGQTLGFLSLSAAAFFTSYWYFATEEAPVRLMDRVGAHFLWLGTLWWGVGGFSEINRVLSDGTAIGSAVGFATVSAVLLAGVSELLHWPSLRRPTRLLTPVLFSVLAYAGIVTSHPLTGIGAIAWPIGLVVVFGLLARYERDGNDPVSRLLHPAAIWLLAVVATWELVYFSNEYGPSGDVWNAISVMVVPLFLTWAVTVGADRLRARAVMAEPLSQSTMLLGAGPLLAITWFWSILLSFIFDADPAPLTYLPLLNPLDIVLGLGVFAAVRWYRSAIPLPGSWGETLTWLLGASVFVYLNATVGRSVHYFGDVDFGPQSLWNSGLFQTSTSIVWTLAAVAVMIYSSRRSVRTLWIVGATLLGVVVVKLFLVDLVSISTLMRIVSFIVVGLLILVVAYLTPIPPEPPGSEEA